MKRINNKKFASNILTISLISILIVYLFVEFKLSQNDMVSFIVMFNSMLLTAFMILILIIFIIIFLARMVSKKGNCFGRTLSIITAITIVMILSTAIIVREESRYYHTVNMNWKINLPREYEEIYYTDSGPSFHGDGERYSVFKYETLNEINNVVEWREKNNIEPFVMSILGRLEVPKEYYPDFNDDFRYYYEMKEDRSEIYIILNSRLKKVYIVENFL